MGKIELYKKLQEIRVALQEMDLTKSGYNKFSDYKYFELSDFLPKIQKLALEKGIIPIYQLEKEQATLHICDIEDMDSSITFSIPTADAATKGSNAIQAVGSLTTYTRRYLYMIAFEIAENDDFDYLQVPDDIPIPVVDTQDDLIDNAKIKAIQNTIKKKGLSETGVLERYKIDDFHDMLLSQWMHAMDILNKQPDLEGEQ